MVIVKSARRTRRRCCRRCGRAVASVDPALPIYDVMTLDERIGAALSRPRFNATLVAAFGGAALLLAAIGVYGVLSYSVSSRMREIGVRLALGADASGVMRLVLGEGLKLAAIGAAVGHRVRAGRRAGSSRDCSSARAVDPPRAHRRRGHHAGHGRAAAAWLPARRAAAVDPITVLRDP